MYLVFDVYMVDVGKGFLCVVVCYYRVYYGRKVFYY